MLPAERCPAAWAHREVHSSGDGGAGSSCPAWASVAASVGTGDVVGGVMVGMVVGMVVGEVVVEVRMGRVRHMASVTEMVQVSQVAPA